MRRVCRALLLFAALLTSVAHCSVLVDDELSSLRCVQEGSLGQPACDPGELCAAGHCRACVAVDVCQDGVDNDCNGRIDDRCVASGGAGGDGAGGNDGATGAAGSEPDSN